MLFHSRPLSAHCNVWGSVPIEERDPRTYLHEIEALCIEKRHGSSTNNMQGRGNG